MQFKDRKIPLGGLNKDDNPSVMPDGDYSDAHNMRITSSDEQHGAGMAETLQGEVEELIRVSAEFLYYGGAIGGDFIYDGFEEVRIGNQVWMKRNVDINYPGSKVFNDDESNRDIYGGLYTWDQAMEEDFCPPGWRVPNEADVDELLEYLGGALIAGGKMKVVGTEVWIEPNTDADDLSGFSALPGGWFDAFDLLGEMGLFWIAEEFDTDISSNILLVTGETPSKIYAYNPPTKTLTLLDVPGIVDRSDDIAHTVDKMWIYQLLWLNESDYVLSYAEYDISLNPFSATFNRNIINYLGNPGLSAIDNNVLVEIHTFGDNSCQCYEIDISVDPAVPSYKFHLLPNRFVTGDYMITTTGKLIVTTNWIEDMWITQYDYTTGVMEVDIVLTGLVEGAYGLFEYDGEIYIVDNLIITDPDTTKIWKIDNTPPYGLTLFDTILIPIYGASQLAEYIITDFID